MDIDNPAVEVPEDSAFHIFLPHVYRPIVLVCIGAWAWALNVHILSAVNVDVGSLLSLQGMTKQTLQRPIYGLALFLSAIVGCNLWFFWMVLLSKREDWRSAGDYHTWLPAACYLSVFAMLFWPTNVLYKKERTRFLRQGDTYMVMVELTILNRTLKRVFHPSLFAEVFFVDIILADILTSFAKVFGDMWATACALIVGRGSVNFLIFEDRSRCYADIVSPIFTAIPYMIRFRQCISEYIASNYTAKRHLFNALKYASAFPVILFSALQKASAIRMEDSSEHRYFWIGDVGLFRIWIFFVLVNSLYSFYWDVVCDWNLVEASSTLPVSPLPSPSLSRSSFINTSHPSHQRTSSRSLIGNTFAFLSPNASTTYRPSILRFRQQLYFGDPLIYYLAIAVDFLLRTTWSLKLSSHLYIAQLEGSIFLMEFLEVLRRWVWVFFRLESEWVRKSHTFRGEYIMVSTGTRANHDPNETVETVFDADALELKANG